MQELYHPEHLEKKVQEDWEKRQCFIAKVDKNKEKYYCLTMLPYPSGEVHMGHIRNYTIGDVQARHARMQGKNVLQPMGWDSFGLPAENAAIKHQQSPANWTRENIKRIRHTFKRMGYAYDWRRELSTCEPNYYRWEQWMFLQLYKKGLAYKKQSMVNWDPVDRTVLANEQVVDGRGWRSDAKIERRSIEQWFLKISDYSEQLLDDLKQLDGWPEQVKTMQKNWIGRSRGYQLNFILDTKADIDIDIDKITVFTTRIETICAVPFIVIASDHPLCSAIAKTNPKVAEFITQCAHLGTAEAKVATAEKTGCPLEISVKHPITGESLPLWTANYVLMGYGTGCVMAVPAHDARDFEFAKKYNLPIPHVILDPKYPDWDYEKAALVTAEGTLTNSGDFNGMALRQGKKALMEHFTAQGLGKQHTQFRLRDWGISRQRYWGTPIPIIYCPDCGTVPVPEDQLPVILPTDIIPKEEGNTLQNCAEFYETKCPTCGGDAHRETDTMDTFVESSWYFARYCSYDQKEKMLDERAEYWLPADQYVGGIEHAVLHLLYARFYNKLLRDIGLITHDEPFKNLLTQGMVLKDSAKMSKSKGNTVSPNELIERYGADTVRLFIIFAAPPTQDLEWSDSAVEGSFRFLKKLWHIAFQASEWLNHSLHDEKKEILEKLDEQSTDDAQLLEKRRQIHLNLQQANRDFDKLQLNTVVSAAMKIQHTLTSLLPAENKQQKCVFYEGLAILLQLLAPITPHICQSIWHACHFGEQIIDSPWPEVDLQAITCKKIQMIIQVNGKVRSKIQVDAEENIETIKQLAQEDANIIRHLEGKTIRKIIVVPQKLINIVAST